MGSKVISVSIKDTHAEFLKNNELLSPSDIIQSGIDAAIAYHKANNVQISRMQTNIKALQDEISLLTQFLDDKGIFEDWRKWRGEHIRGQLINAF